MKISEVKPEEEKMSLEVSFSEWQAIFKGLDLKIEEGLEIPINDIVLSEIVSRQIVPQIEKINLAETDALILRTEFGMSPMNVDKLRRFLCDAFKKRFKIISLKIGDTLEGLSSQNKASIINLLLSKKEDDEPKVS